MRKSSVALLAAAAGCFFVSPALAQDSPPTVHVVTVSSFRVPLGPDRGKVLEYMRNWIVPVTKVNPKVLSYRVVQHWYGSNASDMAIIAEYANFADLTGPCEPCAAWFAEHFPKEGTPERAAVDELAALYFKYNSTHQDQIYSADMSLAKP